MCKSLGKRWLWFGTGWRSKGSEGSSIGDRKEKHPRFAYGTDIACVRGDGAKVSVRLG